MSSTTIEQEVAPKLAAPRGDMAELIQALDWSRTPLGPMDTWSPTLRMMVPFVLANRFPMLLWWGPQFVNIYNDAYRPILGAKHPRALGQRVSECWSEIWHILEPLIETPYRGGPATWLEDFALEFRRHGYWEEAHFTVAYSPVPDETAASGIGGVLATVHEITGKVIGERRVQLLRELGARVEAKSADEACAAAAAVLGSFAKDIPFALFYLADGGHNRLRLAGAVGVEPGARISPLTVELGAGNAAWPFQAALRSRGPEVVERLAERFGEVPPGPWPDPPTTAVVVPLKSQLAHQLAGFLVIGTSSRLRFDEQYQSFVELLAAQVATAIANARAYEEERRRADALAEIDRAKTAFFSNVSHEFRTPLTLMLGPLEDVLARPDEAPLAASRDQLQVTHRNSLRLLKLVNTLLDFSRLEAGRLTANYERVDLSAFTAELAAVFRSAVEKAGLQLRVDCPPLAGTAYVDRDMWEKIVFNLLSNALKFTLAGEIAVRVRQAGSNFELTVTDSGVGIPEQELPNLFKRFHRIENVRSRTHEGTGIGLALVLELTRLHGGQVNVTSREGEGSQFTVTLPAGRAHLPDEQVEPIGTETGPYQTRHASSLTRIKAESFLEEALRWLPGESAAPFAPPPREQARFSARPKAARIVLIDDNADMREYVRRLLGVSYVVDSFSDGEAALAALREERPDLLLTDVMMPRLDGFGLLKAIRSDPKLNTLPVILLSARAGEEASVEGYDAGADDYLIKPFTARELLSRVAAHLKMGRLRAEIAAQNSKLSAQDLASRRLAAIVESSDDAIISKTLDGIITSWNQGAERLFGYAPEEIIGESILVLIPPERRDEEPQILARLRQGEPIEHYETVRRHKDGRLLDVSLTVSPIRDERGRVIGASKIARDITARRRADARQRALVDMLASVNRAAALPEIYEAALNAMLRCLNADRASILLSDEQHVMRFVAWRGLSDGYRAVVEGHSPWSPGDPDPQPVCIDNLNDVTLEPRIRTVVEKEGIWALAFIPLTYERRLMGKLMLYYDAPHGFEPGEVQLASAIASQIAFAVQRQRGAQALEALVAERTRSLREAVGQMEEFSYSVSHDLRSPVRAMRGFAEVLLEDYGAQLDEQGRDLLTRICRNGVRMDRLIQDLLTYSRISRLEIGLEPVPLDRVLRNVIDQYPELRPTRATIEIPASLPLVLAHEPSLTQVLSNLLSNAVKFVAPGRRPCVVVSAEQRAGVVRVSLADNGIGVPPDYQGRLFNMFERLHPQLNYEGTGIGLAIVRKAMERMNGKVGMHSLEAGGSCFWIELPIPSAT
jgi:PAS domain S-box-containing protein